MVKKEMNKLQSLIAKEKLITFTPEQIKDFSRTLILIIKHFIKLFIMKFDLHLLGEHQ